MCENNGLVEKLLESEKELEHCDNELQSWTDSLEELSEIEDAFKMDDEFKLEGKTILDVGTDCIKPLYIALKLKPHKIIGINEDLSYSYASNIEQNSKLFIHPSKIRLYNCSFFNKEKLNRILRKEKIEKFDFVLVSKTLHHLRTGKCIADKRNKNHKKEGKCPEDEKCCIYEFNPLEIFKYLLHYGKRAIVYEFYDSTVEDDDKVRGRGGYFTKNEWNEIFDSLRGKYIVKFITPQKFQLDEKKPKEIDSMLKKVDDICFYVEEQD
jgi:uncharacterized Fe-S cluster-containing protein